MLVKGYQIAAGGTRYSVPGAKFYLLAASEPLNIQLFSATQKVGELDGLASGLEVGPFCPALTDFLLNTQSGLEGSALIGVGDEELRYNPLGGTLSFANPAQSASAQTPATVSNSSAAVANGKSYSAIFSAPPNATGMGLIQIEAGGFANPATVKVKKLVLRNTTAAAQIYNIGIVSSEMAGSGGTVNQQNLLTGGPASKFVANCINSDTLNPPTGFKYAFSRQVSANDEIEIDLADNPLIGPVGVTAYPTVYCTSLNSAIAGELIWEED